MRAKRFRALVFVLPDQRQFGYKICYQAFRYRTETAASPANLADEYAIDRLTGVDQKWPSPEANRDCAKWLQQ